VSLEYPEESELSYLPFRLRPEGRGELLPEGATPRMPPVAALPPTRGVARRVVETARDAGADFILVTGDTFEDNGMDRVLVQKVADILAGFGGPVYLIPGNHDPLVPGSVWEHPAWKSISRSASPVAV